MKKYKNTVQTRSSSGVEMSSTQINDAGNQTKHYKKDISTPLDERRLYRGISNLFMNYAV